MVVCLDIGLFPKQSVHIVSYMYIHSRFVLKYFMVYC